MPGADRPGPDQPEMVRRRFALVVALGLLVLLPLLVYWPGLYGSFLFDDFANLPVLGRYGPIVDLPGVLRYLTSGIADPTGRPLSNLSFLLDANNWPAQAFPFKRTNLIIHLVNGGLLCLVLLRLGGFVQMPAAQARPAAILGTALWVLHPLWVSTVLYVVQRHALLATTFVLLGILVWLAAQTAFNDGRRVRGWILALLSVGGCGLLAGLSKPNGLLLPTLLLMLHLTVINQGAGADRRSWRRAPEVWLLLILPSLLIVIGLIAFTASKDPGLRPWTTGERLLTQPRVLLDYLRLLFLPTAYSSGLFGDGYAVSRSMFDPLSTLPALLVVLALPVLALALRQRHPLLAAALLFFLGGHIFESSVLPLELYFEHRSYLPAALLFWALAAVLTAPGPAPGWRRIGAVGLLVIFSALTLVRAQLWGQPLQLALSWARDLPDSARAQTHAANELLNAGHGEAAIARMRPLLAEHPDEAQYALTLMNAACARGVVDEPLLSAAATALHAKGVGLDITHQWLVGTAKRTEGAACAALATAPLQRLVEEARAHPKRTEEIESRLTRIDAYLALREGACDEAVTLFNRRLEIQRRPEATLEQTGFLATRCGPAHALAHLRHYRSGAARGDTRADTPVLRLRDAIMQRQEYWTRELDRLESVLLEELAEAQARAPQG